MKQRTATARVAVMFALLVFAFGAALVLNVNTGSLSIAPGRIFKIILHGGTDGTPAGNVIWKIRLPRLLAAAVLGGALSVSGFLLQTFFRNPIAGPYVLGISSGAKMLVGIAMIFLLRRLSGVPFWVMMAAAFLGSMLVTGFVLLFARRVKSMSALLVIGIMIGSVCTAVTDFFITFADEANVANLHAWSMGSFSAISWKSLHIASAVIFVAVIGAFLLSKPIAAYRLGENYARSMGVPVRLVHTVIILTTCLLAGVSTAFTGPIAFIGIAVPHIVRGLVNSSDHRIVLPASLLFGATLLLVCDIVSCIPQYSLPINSMCAVVGAPIIIWVIFKNKKIQQ